MSHRRQYGRWLWLIAGLSWAAAAGFLLHRDIRIAQAGDHRLPPARPVKGAESFCDDFRSANALAGWSTAFPWGARNLGQGELEAYASPQNRLNPFSTDTAGLTITARRIPPAWRSAFGGREYASGLLTSYRLFRQRYGYFEIRARFPAGKGLWPAFWLAPANLSWPPEIDVVEMLGNRPDRLNVTLHRRDRRGGDRPTGFVVTVPNMTHRFHTYGALWTPHYVAWYFDGHRVAFTRADRVRTPMYLLVNLAVGGDWGGDPDAATKFPARMVVAYVRAFRLPGQKAKDTAGGRLRCGKGVAKGGIK